MKKKLSALFLALSIGLNLFPAALAQEDISALSAAEDIQPADSQELQPQDSPASEPDPEPESSDFVIENGVLTKYTGPGGAVVIPDGVTAIGDYVFYGCHGLTSLVIPDGVTSVGRDAFRETALTSLVIPDSVTSINAYAFKDCAQLTDLFIPSAGIFRGNNMFDGCSSLRTITVSQMFGIDSYNLPKGVKTLAGDGTDLTGLSIDENGVLYDFSRSGTTVVIPDGITAIRSYGSSTFQDPESITEVILPDSLTSIDCRAFFGCSNLRKITIPSGVTVIGEQAFSGCSSLSGVTIPDSVTTIGGWAFWNCTSLTDITVPSKVTSIGRSAFSGCTGLTDVTLSEGLTAIEREAFSDCTGLTGITIPASVTSIGFQAFSNCSNLTRVVLSNLATTVDGGAFPSGVTLTNPRNPDAFEDFTIQNGVITEYKGIGGEVVIPTGVTAIGDQVFSQCTNIYSVTIPEGVTSIGRYAFSGCSALATVTLPGTLTAIDFSAFSGCSSLTGITIPNSVTKIADSAFHHCTSLKNAVLSQRLTSIPDSVFGQCTSLTGITIPNSVTSIGSEAFSNCTSLKSISIPDSVVTLGVRAFFQCTQLKEVTIGSGLKEIPSHAFFSCSSLSDLSLGKNLRSIGKNAFSGCSSLNSVSIPSGVTSIDENAFSGCKALTGVSIPGSVKLIGSNAFAYTGLKSLSLPQGVTSIGPRAFHGCTDLVSVTIPDSVKTLGADAFSGCSNLTDVTAPDHLGTIVSDFLDHRDFTIQNGVLTKYSGAGGNVVIPGDVTSIGRSAFANCKTLTGVTIPNSVTSIADSAFSSCEALTNVTIPSSVTSIGNRAFSLCSSLTRVSGGQGLTSCPADAFMGCFKLTAMELPDRLLNGSGVFTIENGTLKKYTGLALKVEIPDGVTAIASNAFDSVLARWVTFPSTLTSIPYRALENLPLTDVVIPASVTQIDDVAFSSWGGENNPYHLSNITVHGAAGSYAETWAKKVGYSFVADQAWNVSDLAKEHKFTVENGVLKGYAGPGGDVVIPDGVTEISYGVLDSIGMLDSLTLPAGIKNVSIRNSSVRRIAVGWGATQVSLQCDKLESVSLPDTVESLSISSKALRELTIPSGVTMWPSLSCPRLSKLTFPSGNWVFKGISRSDFMDNIRRYPALNTVVNCPNEFVDDLIAANKALMDNWTDPRSTISAQSDRIVKLSNEITAGLTTDYDKAKAISQWVIGHIKYDDDYYYEGLKDYSDVPFHPEDILDKGQAVCAGISRLTQALMVAQGIPCLYVLGWTAPGYHAWNLALIDGEYLWIDNTWGSSYFGLGLYAISRDHTATGAASFNNVKGPGTLVSGSAGAEETSETAEEILVREKIEALKEQYPEGMRWTNENSYYSAAFHSTGSGCAGFAYLCSDAAFGDAPVVETHSDFSRIRVGDVLRINNDTHSVIVLQKLDNSVIVAEGNYNSSIHWGREISRADLEKGNMTVTTRWGDKTKAVEETWLTASTWAQEEVEAAVTAQLVPQELQSGYTDLITRQEFCTLMVTLVERKSGQDIDAYLSGRGLTVTNPFTDTADHTVLAAYALGIVKGTSATTFNPYGSITRQEAATMLSRTGKLLGVRAGERQSFADEAQFGSWAVEGIDYTSGLMDAQSGKRVMEGTGNGNFSPLATYSREQAILTALRLYRCA